jgi:chromosome segregation ATPase
MATPSDAALEACLRSMEAKDFTSVLTVLDVWGPSLASMTLPLTAGGGTLVHRAAEVGNPLILSRLLRCEFNCAEKDNRGRTPLMRAAKVGNSDNVRALLHSQALELSDINAIDMSGSTAIIYAVSIDSVVCTELLMQAGASLLGSNAATSALASAAHAACHYGATQVLPVLLAREPSLALALDSHGRTPLHVAAARNEGRCVEALLTAGVDVQATDVSGQTPLDCALAANAVSAIKRLQPRMDDSVPLVAATPHQPATRAGGRSPLVSSTSTRGNLSSSTASSVSSALSPAAVGKSASPRKHDGLRQQLASAVRSAQIAEGRAQAMEAAMSRWEQGHESPVAGTQRSERSPSRAHYAHSQVIMQTSPPPETRLQTSRQVTSPLRRRSPSPTPGGKKGGAATAKWLPTSMEDPTEDADRPLERLSHDVEELQFLLRHSMREKQTLKTALTESNAQVLQLQEEAGDLRLRVEELEVTTRLSAQQGQQAGEKEMNEQLKSSESGKRKAEMLLAQKTKSMKASLKEAHDSLTEEAESRAAAVEAVTTARRENAKLRSALQVANKKSKEATIQAEVTKSQCLKLQEQCDALLTKEREASARADDCVRSTNAAEKDARIARKEMEKALSKADSASGELKRVEAELAETSARLQTWESEANRLRSENDRVKEEFQELDRKYQSLERLHSLNEEQLKASATQLADCRADIKANMEEITRLKDVDQNLRDLTHKFQYLEKEYGQVKAELDELQSERALLNKQIHECEKEQLKVSFSIEKLQLAAETHQTEKEEWQKARLEMEERVSNAEKERRAIAEHNQRQEEDLKSLEQIISEKDNRIQELEEDCENQNSLRVGLVQDVETARNELAEKDFEIGRLQDSVRENEDLQRDSDETVRQVMEDRDRFARQLAEKHEQYEKQSDEIMQLLDKEGTLKGQVARCQSGWDKCVDELGKLEVFLLEHSGESSPGKSSRGDIVDRCVAQLESFRQESKELCEKLDGCQSLVVVLREEKQRLEEELEVFRTLHERMQAQVGQTSREVYVLRDENAKLEEQFAISNSLLNQNVSEFNSLALEMKGEYKSAMEVMEAKSVSLLEQKEMEMQKLQKSTPTPVSLHDRSASPIFQERASRQQLQIYPQPSNEIDPVESVDDPTEMHRSGSKHHHHHSALRMVSLDSTNYVDGRSPAKTQQLSQSTSSTGLVTMDARASNTHTNVAHSSTSPGRRNGQLSQSTSSTELARMQGIEIATSPLARSRSSFVTSASPSAMDSPYQLPASMEDAAQLRTRRQGAFRTKLESSFQDEEAWKQDLWALYQESEDVRYRASVMAMKETRLRGKSEEMLQDMQTKISLLMAESQGLESRAVEAENKLGMMTRKQATLLERAKESLAELEEENAELAEECRSLKERLGDVIHKDERALQEATELSDSVRVLTDENARLKKDVNALTDVIKDLEGMLSHEKSTQETLRRKASQAEQKQAANVSQGKVSDKAVRMLENELDVALQLRSQLEESLNAERAHRRQVDSEHKRCSRVISELSGDKKRLEDSVEKLEVAVASMRSDIENLQQRLKSEVAAKNRLLVDFRHLSLQDIEKPSKNFK